MLKHIAMMVLIPICVIPVCASANAGEPRPAATLDLRAPDLPYRPFEAPEPGATALLAVEEPESVSITTSAGWNEKDIGAYPSALGVGSVYWAFGHPSDAWRVLLPAWPGGEPDVSADIASRCLIRASEPTGSPCP